MSILKKCPQTEMEYWMAIEAIGGFIWRSRHEHFHGRADLPDELIEAQETIEKVAAEAAAKFNLVPMAECETRAPEPTHHEDGREFYWAWYDRMKGVEAEEAHVATICSACPLSGGPARNGSFLKCEPYQGLTKMLVRPWECLMTSTRFGEADWTEDELRAAIEEKGGSWDMYCEKLDELTAEA